MHSPDMPPAAIGEDVELAETQKDSTLRRRNASHNHLPPVASRPFAGRIGGNQEFTLDPDDASFRSVVSKVPDAAATFSWHASFHLRGFADVELWKEATIEGVGVCLQIYIAGLYAIGLGPAVTATSLGPITPAAFGSIANMLLITLFIYAGGPVSGKYSCVLRDGNIEDSVGGHFNPLITMATFFARLSAFPRTILYVTFQCAGSVVAGFLVRASLGAPPEGFVAVPGCYIDTSIVTPGQA
jgi:hypothetical protein